MTFREHRRELIEWYLHLGKNPEKAEGYSYDNVETHMNRLDLFYRFVWDRDDKYVQDLSTDDADDWMRHLAKQNLKETTKCHYQKAVQMLFKWQRHARGKDVEWDPVIEYSDFY